MTSTQLRPVYPLQNDIRPYAWGSVTVLPEFLGVDPTGQPAAELWIGAHPGAPSRVGPGQTLADLIAADPVAALGPQVAERFHRELPYLLKVLAVERPLSLQAHPDLDQAAAGFADEEERGVPIDAPERNYKDPNHKPEQICALTPFVGMCGFRPVVRTAELITALGARSLAGYPQRLVAEGGLREVVTGLLTMPDPVIAGLLDDLGPAFDRLADVDGPWQAEGQWLRALNEEHPHDRGVVLALLLNLVHLTPGETMFLGAGVPHVYLQGTGVEIMANSDNVLRCGLTSKHVDVPELMRVLRIDETPTPVADASTVAPGVARYPSAVSDFALTRLDPGAPGADRIELPPGAPRLVLVTRGSIVLSPMQDGWYSSLPDTLGRGRSVFVPAGAGLVVRAEEGTPEAFVAAPNI